MMGNLHLFDLLIVLGYLIITIGIGLAFTRRGGKDMGSYFLSGRNLSWWVAGLSLVATAFAADTPLWVTSLVRKYGLPAVWQFWAMLIGASLSAVLFCRWWRRLEVTTDIEFLELRYAGRPAAVLRGWNGAFQAFIMCPLTIAWVTKAMGAIARETLGLPVEQEWIAIAAVLIFSVPVCASSGLDGVVFTGVIIFFFCLLAGIMTAGFALHQVGGIEGMMSGVQQNAPWASEGLRILPKIGSAPGEMSPWNAVGYFGLLWIGNAYSGAFIAQRMMACRDTRHATFAQVIFSVVYYGILAWPWIIVALCSLSLIGNVGVASSDDGAYVAVAMKVLPIGLKGVFVASMLAAFTSTITALFNWGSSYMVNDIYKRFAVRNASPHHYVWVGRIATVLLAVVGGICSTRANDIQQLLEFGYVIGGSQFILLVMRWLWPRLTAWGELAGLAVSVVFSILLLSGTLNPAARIIFSLEPDIAFNAEYSLLGARVLLMIFVTTLTAVIVSLLGPAVSGDVLADFARRARPFTALWKRVASDMPPAFETIRGTLFSWTLIAGLLVLLLDCVRNLLLGSLFSGVIELMFCVLLTGWIVQRVFADYRRECELNERGVAE